MGCCLKLILFFHVAVAALVGFLFWGILTDRLPPMPDVPEVPEMWFGKGERVKQDTAIRPFKIRVEDKVLEDLKTRIEMDLTRLTPPLEGAAFHYGFNTDYLKEVGEYWLNKYDWRAQEAMLNSFKHFKTRIDGLDIHFIRAKPDPEKAKGKKVIPMLLVHGWPGSVLEFTKIIPLLTTPTPDQDFVFEVIAPSIPGYAYSSAPAQMGFNSRQCARIFNKLMNRLGHDKYYTQGGDWGSYITQHLSILYPESVYGLHINMISPRNPPSNILYFLAAWLPSDWIVSKKDEGKILPFMDRLGDMMLETGYLHIQATKPDTVGVGMGTSPLGLAAYVLEKFSTGTNKGYRGFPDGGLTKKHKMDDLLTNLMLYWTTNSMTSAMRFYKENLKFDEMQERMERLPITVPAGLAAFANEPINSPRKFAETKFKNIVQYSDLFEGGHFAALEVPKSLHKDFVSFVSKVEKLKLSKPSKSEL